MIGDEAYFVFLRSRRLRCVIPCPQSYFDTASQSIYIYISAVCRFCSRFCRCSRPSRNYYYYCDLLRYASWSRSLTITIQFNIKQRFPVVSRHVLYANRCFQCFRTIPYDVDAVVRE